MVSWILMVTTIQSLMLIVAMVVTIESKVIINGKFYATGPKLVLFDMVKCINDFCTHTCLKGKSSPELP